MEYRPARKGSANVALPLFMLLISAAASVPSFFEIALPLLARSIGVAFLISAALFALRYTLTNFYYALEEDTLYIHRVLFVDRVVVSVPLSDIEKTVPLKKNRTFSPFARAFSVRDFCVNAYPEKALRLCGKKFKFTVEMDGEVLEKLGVRSSEA